MDVERAQLSQTGSRQGWNGGRWARQGEIMGWTYDTSSIDRLILPFLMERKGLQKTVINAMNDAVEAGGKRVRPILM